MTAPTDSDDASDDRPADGPADGTVRRYRPGDREAVWRLHERALADAGTDPADVPGVDDLDRIEEEYLANGEFLVIEAPDGEVVAMGGIRVEDDGDDGTDGDDGIDGDGTDGDDDGVVAEVHRMRVAPERQRDGLGAVVLDGLERAAHDRGADRVVLTTAARQTAATRFYPARGYREAGRRRHDEYELVRFEKRL